MTPPTTIICENKGQDPTAEEQAWTFTTDDGEVIVLDDSPVMPGQFTCLMAEAALSRVWETPQEDEAWRDL